MPSFPFVEVEGAAERDVKPDEVRIDFQVVAFSEDSETSLEMLTSYSMAALDVLKKFGVKESAIEGSEVQKSEVRKTEDRKKMEVLGYDFSRSYTVEFTELKNYPGIMKELFALEGVNGLYSSFDVSDREALKVELLREACQIAKKKAENLAAGMDVKLGPLYAINGTGRVFVFSRGGRFEGLPALYSVGGEADAKLFFVPSTVEVSSTVGAIFRLEE
ncbi:MAG: SIMPL domain-containing protein [Roseibacillus sp.]